MVSVTYVPCEQELGTAFIVKLRTFGSVHKYLRGNGVMGSVPQKFRDEAFDEIGAAFGKEYIRLLRLNINLDAGCKNQVTEVFDEIGGSRLNPREVSYHIEMTAKFLSFNHLRTK